MENRIWRGGIIIAALVSLDCSTAPRPVIDPAHQGERIVYSTSVIEGKWYRPGALFSYSLENNIAEKISPDNLHCFRFRRSPDGEKIAFHARNFFADCGEESLYIVNSDGSSLRQVMADVRQENTVSWYPDSKSFFMQVDSTLKRYDLERGEFTNFCQIRDGYDLSCSPDGMWITYLEIEDFEKDPPKTIWTDMGDVTAGIVRLNRNNKIHLIDMNGEDRCIFSVESKPTEEGVGLKSWTPDSKSIVFSGKDWLYRSLDIESGQVKFVEKTGWRFVYSPDKRQIAYQAEVKGNQEIFVMNADGTNARQITRLNGTSIYPCWSPDGDEIAFCSRNPETEKHQNPGFWHKYSLNTGFELYIANVKTGKMNNCPRVRWEDWEIMGKRPYYYWDGN
jgi:Tol biopolymer transport system component